MNTDVQEPSAKYLLQKDFHPSEIGPIPRDWALSTVGAEFNVQLGKMLDAERNVGIEKPYLGNKAVQWGRVEVSETQTMRMSRADLEKFRLQSGDLLVCEGGEVGRAAIWDAPLNECYYQKALHRLRPIRGYEPRLMLAVLQLWASRGVLANYVTQTSIAHLPKEKFVAVPIPLPTPDEQRAIATALSDVDALIAGLERLIAKKRDIKQATMQQLLTGQTRLPGFSGEWSVQRIANVAQVDPCNLGADTDRNFEFRYIALEDVDEGTLLSWSDQVFGSAPSRARRRLQYGDVLVSTVRPNLKSHLLFCESCGEWVCSTGFSVVRCQADKAVPGFIFANLFASGVNRQIDALLTGSNYPAINSTDVRALEILLPSVNEQTAIATVLSDMDADLSALEARLAKTRAIKQGMMQELLTGRTRLVGNT
jgi:type I restriction enzyme S subunit